MECAVSCTISAPAHVIWRLLTDAKDFPRWNSTVSSIDGEIVKGSRLAIRVPISDRTFTPKVTELEPEKRMVWSDGMAPMFKGERTFTITPLEAQGDHHRQCEFSMAEVFSGVMLPMIKGSLPDFAPVFEKYAQDLKAEAERQAAAP